MRLRSTCPGKLAEEEVVVRKGWIVEGWTSGSHVRKKSLSVAYVILAADRNCVGMRLP